MDPIILLRAEVHFSEVYQQAPAHIDRIPSWDNVDGDHGMHPPDKQISATDSKAALDQLVALGYIEEPSADKSKALEQTVRELDYNLAQSYIDGGIYNEAVAILERLYQRWPMEHRFGFKLATCYQCQNRSADLRTLVTVLIERRLGEAKTAVSELKALKLDDQDAQKSERERIETMTNKEQQEFARERRELLAKARPNLFSLHYLEACADRGEKKYEEALTKLEQLDSDFGARRNALTLRGEVLSKLKRWPDSRRAYEQALDIDSETPGPLLGLARVCLAEKAYQDATDYARASLGLLFFQPRAHYIDGVALYRLGEWQSAEQAFLICVRQAPLFAAAYRMLAEIVRWCKHDPHETTFLQKQVKVSRERMAELKANATSGLLPLGEVIFEENDQRPMPPLEPFSSVPSEQTITIVTGLPRSGTSLMMQILEAAGVAPHSDVSRPANASNPNGYYEHEKAASLLTQHDCSWPAEAKGKSLKVVAPLVATLPVKQLHTSGSTLRILFMERSMEEILTSQHVMLDRIGKQPPQGQVSKAYHQQVRAAKNWITNHRIPAMSVSYEQLVHAPDTILEELASFLGAEDKIDAMRAVIDPTLHRARRKQELTPV